jgi:GNAT superfamily N-acetyltransferase
VNECYEIRVASPDDALGIVEVTDPIDVSSLSSPSGLRALLARSAAEATERLVACEAKRIVAWCPSGVHDDGSGWFWIGVAASARRRGIGRTLYERVETRLVTRRCRSLTTVISDDAGRRFVEARGFEPLNVVSMQILELEAATLPTEPISNAVSLGETDERSLYELYSHVRADVPSTVARHTLSRTEFERDVLGDDLLDRDASVVLFEAGIPVAFSIVRSTRATGRAEVEITGVRRDYRGRGLATAAKTDSLRRARELGITRVLTTNDLDNAPMLAINRKLGFEPSVLIESYGKQLPPHAGNLSGSAGDGRKARRRP